MQYGYARVSTTDQDLSIQSDALKAAGCDVIRSEKVTGHDARRTHGTRNTRFHPEGDVLVVTRIDRLARSVGDLQDIVRAIKAKGAALKATEQPIDTSTAAGKCFLDMLGVFAEFETNLRRERQMEGISKAKAAGIYRAVSPASISATVSTLHAPFPSLAWAAGWAPAGEICTGGQRAGNGRQPIRRRGVALRPHDLLPTVKRTRGLLNLHPRRPLTAGAQKFFIWRE